MEQRYRPNYRSSQLANLIMSDLTPPDLLALHANVADELRSRDILRSSNNPTGDLAEYMFCQAFPDWYRADNSHAHIDAIGSDGKRYQIKGCRITRHSKSRQMSAIRDLDGAHFDYLAGLLFAEDYSVLRAAIIPHSVVVQNSKYGTHTNSHRFLLRDEIWSAPNVLDVTLELQKATF
jgi:hypothetical protein